MAMLIISIMRCENQRKISCGVTSNYQIKDIILPYDKERSMYICVL